MNGKENKLITLENNLELSIRDMTIPSANHRNKTSIRKGKIHCHNTDEYIYFKEFLQNECRKKGFKPIAKPTQKNKSVRNVSLGLTIFFKKSGRSDIDGNLKCLQDSLNGIAFEDDRQIKQYHKLEIADFSGFNGFDLEIKEIGK